MSSYTHLTLEERKYLQQLLAEGYGIRQIAYALGRAPSSVSREIKRNAAKYQPRKGSDNKFRYHHWRAHNLYIRRRREQYRQAIKPNSDEWNFIVAGLQKFWSPEAICGRWHLLYPDRKTLSVSTIYRYIRQKKFPNITRNKNLRRRGKRKHTRNTNYNSIQPDRIIPEWPEEIVSRSRFGDWEGDTVYGAIGKGLLVTLVDRKSRRLRMGKLSSRNATETRAVIERLLEGFPVKSISLDNGSEFAEFRQIEDSLNTSVYFAEPHKPWQRGSNENMNDIVRFFFPKGTDFTKVSDEEVAFVEQLINDRPRACLGWKSANEVFDFSVALT